MAKRKSANTDLQNTTQKTKDRATRTPLKPVGEFYSYLMNVSMHAFYFCR